MTPLEAGTWLVADAYARERPVGMALASVGVPREVAMLAAGPEVTPLLRALRVAPDVSALAQVWPRALAPALRRLEGLPQVFGFRLHLAQTVAYLFFVGVVQLGVASVLKARAWPALELAGQAYGLDDTLFIQELAGMVVVLLSLVAMAWLLLGAVGWTRLPGWSRHLARAREASLAAALLEASPPDDVRLAWLGRARWFGDPALAPVDLDTVAREASLAAERAMTHFLTRVRLVGLSLLTLNALGIVVSVYGFLARFPGGVS